MLRKILLAAALTVSLAAAADINDIVGRWITVDDKTGEKRSIVRIFKATNGKYYGKIEKILDSRFVGALCVPCKGDDHNKPVEGLIIIRDMVYADGKLQKGSVLDPESGNFYFGSISYDAEKGQLKLRGSLDKRGIFGRNQYWIRYE